MSTQTYDLVVIGGGPAGASGANVAAASGKRVALIEKAAELGGACFNCPTLGDLSKYATYDAIGQRAHATAPTP